MADLHVRYTLLFACSHCACPGVQEYCMKMMMCEQWVTSMSEIPLFACSHRAHPAGGTAGADQAHHPVSAEAAGHQVRSLR